MFYSLCLRYIGRNCAGQSYCLSWFGVSAALHADDHYGSVRYAPIMCTVVLLYVLIWFVEQTISDEFLNLDLPIFADRNGVITVYLKISSMAGSGLMWEANNIFEEYAEDAVG